MKACRSKLLAERKRRDRERRERNVRLALEAQWRRESEAMAPKRRRTMREKYEARVLLGSLIAAAY